MILDLKKLFLDKSEKISGQYEFSLSDTKIDGVFPFITPIDISYNVENRAGIIKLKADLKFDFSYPCSRCMEDVLKTIECSFSHVLVNYLNDDNLDDEYVLLEDYKINLDKLLKEDILLQMPTKVLCSPDCKGLCQKCGKNLNEGTCKCTSDSIDPRLEVLKNLLS